MAVIIPIEQLEPAFNNAMEELRHQYRSEVVTVGSAARKWKEHYDCYLFHDALFNWESIGFKDNEQHAWFVLKWS